MTVIDFRKLNKIVYGGDTYKEANIGPELMWKRKEKVEGVFKREEVDLSGLINHTPKSVTVGEWQGEYYLSASIDQRAPIGRIRYVSYNDWFIATDGRIDSFLFDFVADKDLIEKITGLPLAKDAFYMNEGILAHNEVYFWLAPE